MLKKMIATASTLALLLASAAPVMAKEKPPEGAPAKAFHVPPRQKFTLPNGIEVNLVQYGSTPKVAISAVVRTGTIDDPAGKVGLASITGQLMKEGTDSRTAEQVAEQAASMGGSIDVGVGADESFVSTDVLSEFGPKAAALLADVLMHPKLPASELPRLQADALRRLTIARTQPQQLAVERFRQVLYGDHPYGHVLPTEEGLKSFTIEDAQNFYKTHFGAARTRIYVAGKFDPAAMKKAITEAFGKWEKGTPVTLNVPKVEAKKTVEVLNRAGAPQSTLFVGLPVLNPSSPDYVPFTVMNALLGGSFGSRITANIREKHGYTYSPSSQLSARYRDGYWVEIADVTTANTGDSLKEIFNEIDTLQKTPPTAAELQAIKNYMSGVFVIRNSSRNGLIGQLDFVDLHQLGDSYLSTYVQKVTAVTPEQVQAMTAKYIRPDKMTIVVVGDKDKIADQLTTYEGK